MDINNLSDQINDISLDNYKYGDETNMEIIRKLLEKINFETNINLDTETNFETFKRTKKIPCHIKNTIYSEYNDQYSQYTNQYSESDFNNNAMELDVLDDEDYIYFKLEIPDIIMNDISHNNSCDLIDYFTNVLSTSLLSDVIVSTSSSFFLFALFLAGILYIKLIKLFLN